MRIRRSLPIVLAGAGLALAAPAYAAGTSAPDSTSILTLFGSLIALLVPTGLALLVAGGLEPAQARESTLTLLAAAGLAVLAYWAVGFALQFGGVGLIDARPGYNELIWEWSALNESWGTGWGMAGLSGFGLAGAAATPDAYLLFVSRLPWVITATLIPLLALRGRTPAPVALLSGLLSGGLLYPLAGNWLAGGGWLANLGRNLSLGHGLVDFASSGPVFLTAAATTLAGILALVPRREPRTPGEPDPVPPVHLPMLTATGAALVLIGAAGWVVASPLMPWTSVPMALAVVNVLLAGAGGALLPMAYSWFTMSRANPLLAARGVTGGVVCGLAIAGFVPPWAALLLGALTGLLVPLLGYLVETILRLPDNSGSIGMFFTGSLAGLLGVALLADGRSGAGWNGVGATSYLGVPGQGVTGLWAAAGFQPDWPGQLQAQGAGIAAIALFSFLLASIAFGVLAALLRVWQGSARPAIAVEPALAPEVPEPGVPRDLALPVTQSEQG